MVAILQRIGSAAAVVLVGVAATALAQPSGPNCLYWRAELPGNLHYFVPHRAITSLSLSQYVVDGAMRVTEVSVGTSGSVQGRFYHIEPLTPQSPIGVGQSAIADLKERARELTERLGADEVWSKVVKNYPATTHAHTAEFRLESVDAVRALYGSLVTSFTEGQSVTFKP